MRTTEPTPRQIQAVLKRAAKYGATARPPVMPKSAPTSTEREAERKILEARRLVPALTALIALFPGDCSSRRTDYRHRDESPATKAERRRQGSTLQACPRISVGEAYAAALRAQSA